MDKYQLELRVKNLEQKIVDLSECLNLAFKYINNDPQGSLWRSRTTLEKILLRIYREEMDKEPKKKEIGYMLNDNQFTRNIDRRIVSMMNNIRDKGNLGTHGEMVKNKDAEKILDELCDVVEWYLDRYNSENIKDSNENKETLGRVTKNNDPNYIETLLDNEAWEKAKGENTIEAYEKYIINQGKVKLHVDEAWAAIDKIESEINADEEAWEKAKAQNTSGAYNDYLKGTTIKKYGEKALKFIRNMKSKERIDEKAWNKAKVQNTIEAYENYINGDTIKSYLSEAENQLEKLILQKRDEDEWEKAVKENTILSYEKYINGDTSRVHLEEALKRKEELEKLQDENQWQRALKANTIEGFQKYTNSKNRLKAYKKFALEHIERLKEEEMNINIHDKAVEIMKMCAEQGVEKAQYDLGFMYYKGDKVQKDFKEAKKWFEKSAAQGNNEAQKMLGDIYYKGKGQKVDKIKAAKWYEQSAQNDNAIAQNNLAYMYLKGDGVQKDLTKAAKWYTSAAEQGNTNAQWSLGNMYYVGQGVNKSKVQARKWYKVSANKGNSNAQFSLGFMYEKGEVTGEIDIQKAKELYRKASEQGHKLAKDRLEKLNLYE